MSQSNFVTRDGAGYERQMGRWSQRLASPFADFAGLGSGDRVFDMGCGTGSLTAELVRRERGSWCLDSTIPRRT
jgi:cyclopropane fatty-acyl-phospholipid synthase-like methyltransferase